MKNVHFRAAFYCQYYTTFPFKCKHFLQKRDIFHMVFSLNHVKYVCSVLQIMPLYSWFFKKL